MIETPAPLSEIAYAKINLALHVRARRDDGYHDLETLFAFLDDGDHLSAEPSDAISLTVSGPFAALLGDDPDNLVLRAARAMQAHFGIEQGAAIRLDKRLPVAAGIGGGSADAAAAARMLARLWQVNADTDALIAANGHLGADIPACIVSRAMAAHGTGADFHAIADDVAGRPMLLVNPAVPLATGPVFRGWDGQDRGPLPAGSMMEQALAGRNDLEPPAIALCPVIADVLAALAQTGPSLARMSGSGATCFALYDSPAARDAARAAISAAHPGWWTMAGRIK